MPEIFLPDISSMYMLNAQYNGHRSLHISIQHIQVLHLSSSPPKHSLDETMTRKHLWKWPSFKIRLELSLLRGWNDTGGFLCEMLERALQSHGWSSFSTFSILREMIS